MAPAGWRGQRGGTGCHDVLATANIFKRGRASVDIEEEQRRLRSLSSYLVLVVAVRCVLLGVVIFPMAVGMVYVIRPSPQVVRVTVVAAFVLLASSMLVAMAAWFATGVADLVQRRGQFAIRRQKVAFGRDLLRDLVTPVRRRPRPTDPRG